MTNDSTCTAPLPLRLEACDARPCHDEAAREIVRQAKKRTLDVEITRAIARTHILYSNSPHTDERVHHMVMEACAHAHYPVEVKPSRSALAPMRPRRTV